MRQFSFFLHYTKFDMKKRKVVKVTKDKESAYTFTMGFQLISPATLHQPGSQQLLKSGNKRSKLCFILKLQPVAVDIQAFEF